MKKLISVGILLTLLIALSAAQALDNDDCSNASLISAGTTPFDTTTATTDGANVNQCFMTNGVVEDDIPVYNDIWYEYTASSTGGITASLCESSYDTKIVIYDGCECDSITALKCNDDSCDVQSEVTAPVTEGNCYMIRVGGYALSKGEGEISITIFADDSDGDTVADSSDNCPTVSNSNQSDTDSDGYGDACDEDLDGDDTPNVNDNSPSISNFDQVDTDSDGTGDVSDTDKDNDTVLNQVDNCPMLQNTNQVDSDSDGIGDACDNCWIKFNTLQFDSDSDCPVLPFETDPLCGDVCESATGDSDGDGLIDAQDNCVNTPNPDQTNSDADSFGDDCDNCWDMTNENQADADGDFVGDMCDNCISEPNPWQRDNDNDTTGDACDEDSDGDAIPDVADPDKDNDMVPNIADNCPTVPNADQSDINFNQIGDACDVCAYVNQGSYPLVNTSRDFDGDGQGDVCDDFPDEPRPVLDDDGDTVLNKVDNCRWQSNVHQTDSDGDGVGDDCDNCRTIKNKDQNDTWNATSQSAGNDCLFYAYGFTLDTWVHYGSDPICGDACQITACRNITAKGNYTLGKSFTGSMYQNVVACTAPQPTSVPWCYSCLYISSSGANIDGKGYNITANSTNDNWGIFFGANSNKVSNLRVNGYDGTNDEADILIKADSNTVKNVSISNNPGSIDVPSTYSGWWLLGQLDTISYSLPSNPSNFNNISMYVDVQRYSYTYTGDNLKLIFNYPSSVSSSDEKTITLFRDSYAGNYKKPVAEWTNGASGGGTYGKAGTHYGLNTTSNTVWAILDNYNFGLTGEWVLFPVTGNIAPSTTVAFTPASPQAGNTMVCKATLDDTTDHYLYGNWKVLNGTTVKASGTNLPFIDGTLTSFYTIPLYSALKGETWWCVVNNVSDGIVYSDNNGFGWTDHKTIGNTAPYLSGPILNTTSPKTNDLVKCVASAGDADSDPTTIYYNWSKNGVTISGETTNLLDLSTPGYGDLGNTIACGALVGDGIENSSWSISPSGTVSNTAGTVSNMGISDYLNNVNADYSADVSDADNVTACKIEHNNTDVFVNSSEYALDYTTSDTCSIPVKNNRNGDAAIGWYVWLKDLGSNWVRSSLKTEYIIPAYIEECSNITRGDASYVVGKNLVGTQPHGVCIDVQADNVSINCGNDISPFDKRFDDLNTNLYLDSGYSSYYEYDSTMKALSTDFLGTSKMYYLLGANYTDYDSLYAEFLFRTNTMTNGGASGLDLSGYGYLGFMNSADYTKNFVAAAMRGVFQNGLTVYNQSMGAAIKASDGNWYGTTDVEFWWDGTNYLKQDINDTTWYKFIVKYNAGSRTLVTYLYNVSNGGLVGSYSTSIPSDKHFTVDSVGAFGDGSYAYIGAQERVKISYVFANAGTDKVTKIYTDRDSTNMNLRYFENGTENNYMNLSTDKILSKFQRENDFNAFYYQLDTYAVGSSLDETKDFYGRFEFTTPSTFSLTSDSTDDKGYVHFGFLDNVTGKAVGLSIEMGSSGSATLNSYIEGSLMDTTFADFNASTDYMVEVWHNSSSKNVYNRLSSADDGTIIAETHGSAPSTFDYYQVGTWALKDATLKSRFVNDWTITRIKATAGTTGYGTDGLTFMGSGTGTGIQISNQDDVLIKNCNVYNYSTGIKLENSADSNLTNVKLLSNSIGLDTSGSTGTVINNTRFNPTVTDFTYDGDLEISGAAEDLKIQPSDKSGIVYLNILKTSTSAWMNLTMHYKDADLKYVTESTLNIYRNSSDTWTNSIGNSNNVNTARNYVTANISSFGSLFAALGTSVDDDRDGINNTIDKSKKVYSGFFDDTSLGGKSNGTVTDRGSHEVVINDHITSLKGVTITVTGEEDTNATFNLCDGTFTFSKKNSTFDVTCASTDIETIEGYVWMQKTYGPNNVIVGIPAGNAAKIDIVADVLTVSAGIGNSEPLTAVYDGVPRILAPGTAYPSGSADSDNDGVPDSTDNCPLISNPAQTDTDNDGTGDACEAAGPCSNGIKDGDESDVDCGGSCTKCTVTKSCNTISDCASGLTCKNAQCTAVTSDSCTNGVKDFGETGIDCGGATSPCSDCANGFGCIIDDDCQSVYCKEGLCAVDDRGPGNTYNVAPQNSPYSMFIGNDLFLGQYFDSKTDVYIGQAGVSYILFDSDEVSEAISNFNLASLNVETSSSAAGHTVFVSGLNNIHATYGIYKSVLIPAGDAGFAFCCPAAQSINDVVPGCAGMFITQDKIFGGLGGTYFVCANMEGSGGSTQGDTNLTINDSAEGSSAVTNTVVTFNAYYYNKTSGAPLTDATSACTVDIDGTNYSMNYVSADARWNATHVFTSAGTVWWTVWCNTSAPGHFDLTATDSVNITSVVAAPEFSDIAYVLAAVLGAGGFFLIRRRKSF